MYNSKLSGVGMFYLNFFSFFRKPHSSNIETYIINDRVSYIFFHRCVRFNKLGAKQTGVYQCFTSIAETG